MLSLAAMINRKQKRKKTSTMKRCNKKNEETQMTVFYDFVIQKILQQLK